MKLQITYEVKSKTVLPKEIEFAENDRVFTFQINDEQLLSKITITADVPHPEKFYSVITPTPNEYSKATYELKSDSEVFDSVIEDFQDLESLLSFSYNVKEIDWNSRTYKIICETEEEKRLANIYSFEQRGGFPDEPVSVSEERLIDTLQRKRRLSKLTVPLSFYREGKNEYKEMKFINAFYNFYFILEGMYGKGKTKNRDIVREFKNSTELREFVQRVIDEHILNSPEHLAQITHMLRHRNMSLGVDAILELIVRTRGELHHFTDNPNKVQGTPFNHRNFHTIGFIIMGLALNALLFRIVDINIAAKPVVTIGEKTTMSEKEADVYLNSDDLLTAVSQYLARKKIRIQPGTSFQWLITPEAGHELPPIKDISLGILFRETDE